MEGNVYQAPQSDLTQVNPNRQEESVTTLMVSHLEKAAKWAKVLAIMGYVLVGFLLLACIGMLVAAFAGAGIEMLAVFAIYLVFTFIAFKLSRFLQQYARAIRNLSDSYDSYELIEAQEYFRRYVKWLGMIFIISLFVGIIAVIFSGAMLAGGLS